MEDEFIIPEESQEFVFEEYSEDQFVVDTAPQEATQNINDLSNIPDNLIPSDETKLPLIMEITDNIAEVPPQVVLGSIQGIRRIVELGYDCVSFPVYMGGELLGYEIPKDLTPEVGMQPTTTMGKASRFISDVGISFMSYAGPADKAARALGYGEKTKNFIQGAMVANTTFGPKDYLTPDFIVNHIDSVGSPEISKAFKEYIGTDVNNLEMKQEVTRRLLGTIEDWFGGWVFEKGIKLGGKLTKKAYDKSKVIRTKFKEVVFTLGDLANASKRHNNLPDIFEQTLKNIDEYEQAMAKAEELEQFAKRSAHAEDYNTLKAAEGTKKKVDVTLAQPQDAKHRPVDTPEVPKEEVIAPTEAPLPLDKALDTKNISDIHARAKSLMDNLEVVGETAPSSKVIGKLDENLTKAAKTSEEKRKIISGVLSENVTKEAVDSSIIKMLKEGSGFTVDETIDVLNSAILKGLDTRQAAELGAVEMTRLGSLIKSNILSMKKFNPEDIKGLLKEYNRIQVAQDSLASVHGGNLGLYSILQKQGLKAEAVKVLDDVSLDRALGDLRAKQGMKLSAANVEDEMFMRLLEDKRTFIRIQDLVRNHDMEFTELKLLLRKDLDFQEALKTKLGKAGIAVDVFMESAYGGMLSGPTTAIRNAISPFVYLGTELAVTNVSNILAKAGMLENASVRQQMAYSMNEATKKALAEAPAIYKGIADMVASGVPKDDIVKFLTSLEPLAGARMPTLMNRKIGQMSTTKRLIDYTEGNHVIFNKVLRIMDTATSATFGVANLIDLTQTAITANVFRQREIIRRAGEYSMIHQVPLDEAIKMIDGKDVLKSFEQLMEAGTGYLKAFNESDAIKLRAAAESDAKRFLEASVNLTKGENQNSKFIADILNLGDAIQRMGPVTFPVAPFAREKANSIAVMIQQAGITADGITTVLKAHPDYNTSDIAARASLFIGALTVGATLGSYNQLDTMTQFTKGSAKPEELYKAFGEVPLANVGPIPTVMLLGAVLGSTGTIFSDESTNDDTSARFSKAFQAVFMDFIANLNPASDLNEGLTKLSKDPMKFISNFLLTGLPASNLNKQLSEVSRGKIYKDYEDSVNYTLDNVILRSPIGWTPFESFGVERVNYFGTPMSEQRSPKEHELEDILRRKYFIKPEIGFYSELDGHFKLNEKEQKVFNKALASQKEEMIDAILAIEKSDAFDFSNGTIKLSDNGVTIMKEQKIRKIISDYRKRIGGAMKQQMPKLKKKYMEALMKSKQLEFIKE